MIKDSGGERREFSTGAMRDIQEGKGRCDLLPLDVLFDVYMDARPDMSGLVLGDIDSFVQTGEFGYLIAALENFLAHDSNYDGWETLFLELAMHFEEGAKKYPPDLDGTPNWQKGIPLRSYVDSAVRHYLKFRRGDADERHDRAFCFNIVCAIWTCKHKPELNDYAKERTDA